MGGGFVFHYSSPPPLHYSIPLIALNALGCYKARDALR